MARALFSGIPLKMYRHFAVVTILLTVVLAFVAQGENKKLASSTSASGTSSSGPWQKESAAAPVTPVKQAAPTSQSESSNGWDDSETDFGAPMMSAGNGFGSFMPDNVVAANGLSEEYLATLSPDERARLQSSLAEVGIESPEDMERRNAEMLAASQRRSGGNGDI